MARHLRKAARKQAIASVMDLGTPGEQAAHDLIHTHCRRRISGNSPPPLPNIGIIDREPGQQLAASPVPVCSPGRGLLSHPQRGPGQGGAAASSCLPAWVSNAKASSASGCTFRR